MPIRNGAEYIQSLRGRNLEVYLFGELVNEPVDHPMIRPSINAVAETYEIAEKEPELASVHSSLSNTRVNRFLHVTESAARFSQPKSHAEKIRTDLLQLVFRDV